MAGPPWLSAREQQAWRGFLRAHAEVQAHLARQLQRDTELSMADYEVLVPLSEEPSGRLRSFQIASYLQWEKSRVSHQVSRMEQRGLVSREECPTDARGAFVVLTGDGRRAIEGAAPRHVAEVRRVLVDALTPEQVDDLAAISAAVLAHLEGLDAAE